MKIEAYDILTQKGGFTPEQAIAILWAIDIEIENAETQGRFLRAESSSLGVRVSALEVGLRAVHARLAGSKAA